MPNPKINREMFMRSGGELYIFRDDFDTAIPAGSVNGTRSEPGPTGTRVIVDLENKISISTGALVCAGPKAIPAWGDPGARLSKAITREAGKILAYKIFVTSGLLMYGLHASLSFPDNGFYCTATDWHARYGGADIVADTIAAGAVYKMLIALRANGCFLLIQGDKYTYPTIVAHGKVGNTATSYNVFYGFNAVYNLDQVREPLRLWMPTPLISDGFGGIWPITDGAGHPETTGLGAGGYALNWVDTAGVWGSAAGVSSCAALAGGIGFATYDTGKIDVIVDVDLTVVGGRAGIVFRYVDVNNYAYIYHDGTNVAIRKMVGGVDSAVVGPDAKAYGAGKTLRVSTKGTKIRYWYDNSDVIAGGWESTIADAALQTSGIIGLYTTNIGNTFDNFLAYARGTGGEYNSLMRFFSGSVITVNIFPYGDSKTKGDIGLDPGFLKYINTPTINFVESPGKIGVSSRKTSQAAAAIDAELAVNFGSPQFILYNLGANDCGEIRTGVITEAAWKANTAYILDAMHVKYPTAQIYMMRVWFNGYEPECNDMATWADTLIAIRSFCHGGPDERIFLDNGDDGATYTSDGIHPNAAGYALTAVQWRTTMGY